MHPFLISSFISERDAKFSNALKIKYLELIRLNENHFDQFTDSIRLLTKVYADKMFKKPTLFTLHFELKQEKNIHVG